jgi:hypothetical protein
MNIQKAAIISKKKMGKKVRHAPFTEQKRWARG